MYAIESVVYLGSRSIVVTRQADEIHVIYKKFTNSIHLGLIYSAIFIPVDIQSVFEAILLYSCFSDV